MYSMSTLSYLADLSITSTVASSAKAHTGELTKVTVDRLYVQKHGSLDGRSSSASPVGPW